MHQLTPQAEQLCKALIQALSEDDKPGQGTNHRYLIVDQSAYPRLRDIRDLLKRFPSVDILKLEHDAWNGASPVLIEIGNTSETQACFRLFAWLAQQGTYACGLHWLVTPDAIDIAAKRLEARTHAHCPDGSDYVLRWFDTRILAALEKALSESQHAALLACANDWRYVDRHGDLISLPCAGHTNTEPECLPFKLGTDEELALIELGTVDVVLELLQQHAPASIGALNPAQRYDWAQPLVLQAQATGIHNLPEIASYCLLAWQLGDDFASRSPWAERLQSVKQGKSSFPEALNR